MNSNVPTIEHISANSQTETLKLTHTDNSNCVLKYASNTFIFMDNSKQYIVKISTDAHQYYSSIADNAN